jgi:hypothetical protein
MYYLSAKRMVTWLDNNFQRRGFAVKVWFSDDGGRDWDGNRKCIFGGFGSKHKRTSLEKLEHAEQLKEFFDKNLTTYYDFEILQEIDNVF